MLGVKAGAWGLGLRDPAVLGNEHFRFVGAHLHRNVTHMLCHSQGGCSEYLSISVPKPDPKPNRNPNPDCNGLRGGSDYLSISVGVEAGRDLLAHPLLAHRGVDGFLPALPRKPGLKGKAG